MFDALGNILLIMCVVIVVGCGAWGGVCHLINRRRAEQLHREFQLPTDVELIAGVRELAAAVKRQQERDMTRDVHVRHWR